jgi:hypothetical protein
MSSNPVPQCRSIKVFAFHGDRTKVFLKRFYQKLADEKNGTGPGPTPDECLRFAGHTAVSIDGGATRFGLHPNPDPALKIWQVMDSLMNGDRFDSIVHEDTAVFAMATQHQLPEETVEIRVPDACFRGFESTLDAEKKGSQYTYSFPDGMGDCNCVTWLERLGLPLLSGSMDEFIDLLKYTAYRSRRFGECV